MLKVRHDKKNGQLNVSIIQKETLNEGEVDEESGEQKLIECGLETRTVTFEIDTMSAMETPDSVGIDVEISQSPGGVVARAWVLLGREELVPALKILAAFFEIE